MSCFVFPILLFNKLNKFKEFNCKELLERNQNITTHNTEEKIDGNFISQIIYNNFTNVPAINLKIQNVSNTNNGYLHINLITSLIDNTIKVFEISFSDNINNNSYINLLLKYSINAHITRISDIIFLNDNLIGSISLDQSMKIWDTNKCKLINLPILLKEKNQKINKYNFENIHDSNVGIKSNNNIQDKKSQNKIFPIFTKILNESIYSQSFALSNEFLKNFSNFFANLKQLKNEYKDRNDKELIIKLNNMYLECLYQSPKDNSIDKNNLDYFIFIYSEFDQINRVSILELIKYELFKNFSYDNGKYNLKNMQIIFCLIMYLLIFSSNKNDLISITVFLQKIKNKIEIIYNENISRELIVKSEDAIQNPVLEGNKKFYSDILNRINFILDLLLINSSIISQENTSNSKITDGLKELNEILFNDLPSRRHFFDLILKGKYDQIDKLIDENNLFIENIFLCKLKCNTDFKNKNDLINQIEDYREKLNKFSSYIYSKQIYQAQKCQNVITILSNYYN